jgi:hypothetical protein
MATHLTLARLATRQWVTILSLLFGLYTPRGGAMALTPDAISQWIETELSRFLARKGLLDSRQERQLNCA